MVLEETWHATAEETQSSVSPSYLSCDLKEACLQHTWTIVAQMLMNYLLLLDLRLSS